MRVVPVPVLDDNYAYLLVDRHGRAAAVDPAEPQKVLDAAAREGATVATVLTTHKHWDHAGGNDKMKQLCPGIEVIGGVNDHVQGATRAVADGERLRLGDVDVTCIETPGHTNGHICFLCREEGSTAAVFTGDTLFVGGCGRIFAGTPEQMYVSLNEKLATLPHDTQVWCGHEYTVKNLEFAAYVDPNNADVKDKLAWAKAQRAEGKYTIPSTIGGERTYNPFLRCDQPALQKFAGASDPVDVLAAVRRAKDRF